MASSSDNVTDKNLRKAAAVALAIAMHYQEIQKSRGDSLVQILARNIPVQHEGNKSDRENVIQYSLEILTAIHNAFVGLPVEEGLGPEHIGSQGSGSKGDPALEDAKRRRALHAMLDLLSLEGIYPCLSSAVGIPLEQRVISVLPTGVVAKQAPETSSDRPHDEGLLDRILSSLRVILWDERTGIQQIIKGRILPDIIAGVAELGFNTHMLTDNNRETYKAMFRRIITESSTSTLLPVLTSFLTKSSAPWFIAEISFELSRIPLRGNGVIETVVFIASQFAPSLGQTEEMQPSAGPPITVQAIMQTSRLLSSVPRGMNADDYFTNIGSKLLALLDGEDPDLKKTASYVIGSGILGKRTYGAPGTVGHTIFVRPLFDALNGNVKGASAMWLKQFKVDGTPLPESLTDDFGGQILTEESKLLLAIDRLSALCLLHPNPGLLKRLIHPVLLSLWGLHCYSKEHHKSWWEGKVFKLLQTFFSVSTGLSRFESLMENLTWDGGLTWIYGPGSEGGVSIRRRIESVSHDVNLIQAMSTLDDRIDTFLKLLAADPQSEELTGDVLLLVCRQWLLGQSTDKGKMRSEPLQESQLMLRKLVSAKLAEKLLGTSKDILSRNPLKLLELIKQLIESETSDQTAQKRRREDLAHVSIRSLSSLTTSETDIEQPDAEKVESLSTALSLLSTVLTSPDFGLSEQIRSILETIKSQLDLLLPTLPPSLSQPATTASMLLEITLSESITSGDKHEQISSRVSDLEKHRQALQNLSSTLPPVQAEGLSMLSDLVKDSSPILDIPATLTLLLSLITNTDAESSSNDEFIYLNVIKLVGLLASRHPKTVIKTLAERYADRNEDITLDQRLRIGESLLRTVEELGQALVNDAAKVLGETMIEVAARRGRKPKAKKAREEAIEKEKMRKKEDEVPGFDIGKSLEQLGQEMDSDTEDPEVAAHSSNILEAWAAGAASDAEPDDLRARASAISILASAIQTNLAGLGPPIASTSVELALSTLTLELGPESAILRRSAVILLLDLLKALDNARETGVSLGFGFTFNTSSTTAQEGNIGNVFDILQVLGFVESKETDAIVRGHLRVLIESFEAWVEKSLLRGFGAGGGIGQSTTPRFELGDRLAGLDIQPPASQGTRSPSFAGPRIEEIE
ncbi:hypothetical protein AJ80_04978 [Polytolypa hystricis UAMH7299]|uniref:RNA polymerase II assembly factor Rtp1 C-terminal domain-containing protein n=1 Tax=Polytolypa hystricis (strain UAMH7299) TaxID=1447883 RepID=A0A2B7Y7U3_POLH7|nr:hypothetical protein AJ80_04978 [Polytolypa hystricis UAMH7299]